MTGSPIANRILRVLGLVEKTIVVSLIILLVVVLVVAVIKIWTLFATTAGTKLGSITTSADFQEILQNVFGGVLVVFVGLELLETMRAYFADHKIRVEVILFVAIIATGRHIIGLEVHGTDPMTFVGLAVLMVALSGSYYLLKRSTGKAA
jgi:uncharacterized membrane protein (DUF373 family)